MNIFRTHIPRVNASREIILPLPPREYKFLFLKYSMDSFANKQNLLFCRVTTKKTNHYGTRYKRNRDLFVCATAKHEGDRKFFSFLSN